MIFMVKYELLKFPIGVDNDDLLALIVKKTVVFLSFFVIVAIC